MSQQWRDLSEEARTEIADDFIARARARAAMTAAGQGGISHRRLYAYARDAASDHDGAVRDALRRGGHLWREWNAVLDMTGAASLAAAAAAATGDDMPRGADPSGRWRYELRRSPEPPYEYYLIIDLGADEGAPSRFQAASPGAGVEEIELEAPYRGVIQIMLEGEHPLIAVLNHPDRQVRVW